MQLKHQIEIILKDYPKSRDSDITLMIELWKVFYKDHIKKTSNGDFGIYLPSLYHLPREDSVKRIRAIIQNVEGRLLPITFAVRKKRRINELKWRDYINSSTEYKRI